MRRNPLVHRKDYRKEGLERQKQIVTLLQQALQPVNITELAERLGWWRETIKAYLVELIDQGLVEEIEVSRVRREYVLLKEPLH